VSFDPQAHAGLIELGPRLRELAGDAAYRAGRVYLQSGQVKQAAVAGTTAYATVTGSTDYRISVAFGEEVKVTCTCPAHRRSRYCKHVVAVCTALLERPGDFAEVEPAPAPEPTKAAPRPRAAKRAPKGPSAAELRAAGLETVDRVVTELADGGLMSLGPEKAQLIASAAELVKALKLRRLGNLLMALQRAAAAPGRNGIDERHFASLLMDLELTRQASAAQLEGRASMDPQVAEELIGKTWRDEELEPVAGLELLELATLQRSDGGFRIHSVYLADLHRAALYVERQIVPMKLAFKPPARHRGRLMVDQSGLYPGLSPRRIKLHRTRSEPLSIAQVETLIAAAPDRVAMVRAAVREHLQSPFGDHEPATLFRPSRLVQKEGITTALDLDGEAVRVRWSESLRSAVAPWLSGSEPGALFGLMELDRGELNLHCVAVVGTGLPWPLGPVFAGES
jgi:hypothetical protein